MEVVSGFQLYKGKKIPKTAWSSASFYQPLQFLENSEKTLDWSETMINYVDWQAMIQLRKNANWMLKNYKLAIGEIDKNDYIKQDNEYAQMIEALEMQAGRELESMELKNYSFANTIVNILVDEFAKRSSHMTFSDKSPQWANDMLRDKRENIQKILEAKAAIQQMVTMQQMGISPDSDQGKQMIDPKTLQTLPELQHFYNKSYRDIYQQWAEKQMEVDNERFYMQELERIQFRNMLITDREFWHMRMRENDYEVEVWNPPQVAYRKSSASRYISDSSWICHVDYLTVPDTVDKYGFMMSEEQLLTLNTIYGARAASYALDGKDWDGYWQGDKSYEWNRTGPGLGMRQMTSILDQAASGWGGDIVRNILNEGEDIVNINGEFVVRVSTVYWKSERKFYHLTKVDEQGNQFQDIVGENYKVTVPPVYNTLTLKKKTKETLIYGEHLDALWVPETWGGIRIGTNAPGAGWQGTSAAFAPIFLGINTTEPGRLPFQFKGDKNLYGCKLPVEGRVFNDHNTKSRAFIDNIKTWQIGVNVTGNLIQDTMINDYGVIAGIDPNALPKHSLGEDYGPNLLAAAATIMKTGGILPVVSGQRNSDGQLIGHEPLRRIDLSQTERLLGLMKIFDWYKMTGLDSVGMNPRRTGTPIGQESTATEVTQDIAASFSHTEYLFIQHSDELMPRVHQMRTDLAQYYHSTNPSLRLQYMTSGDEQAFFEIDGTQLLGRDYNCKSKTTINARNIMNKIQQMIIQDNTSGADVYDKIQAVQVPSLSNLNTFIKDLQQKQQAEKQQEQQAEQQAQQMEQQHQMQLLQEKQQFDAEQKQLDREEKRYETELMAASRAATGKPPEDAEAVYQQAQDKINNQQQQHLDKMDLEKQKFVVKSKQQEVDQQLKKEKLQTEQDRTKSNVKIAQMSNRNKPKSATKK